MDGDRDGAELDGDGVAPVGAPVDTGMLTVVAAVVVGVMTRTRRQERRAETTMTTIAMTAPRPSPLVACSSLKPPRCLTGGDRCVRTQRIAAVLVALILLILVAAVVVWVSCRLLFGFRVLTSRAVKNKRPPHFRAHVRRETSQ